MGSSRRNSMQKEQSWKHHNTRTYWEAVWWSQQPCLALKHTWTPTEQNTHTTSDPTHYNQWTEINPGRKDNFFSKCSGKTVYMSIEIREKLLFILYEKKNCKWIKDLNINTWYHQLLEEKSQEHLAKHNHKQRLLREDPKSRNSTTEKQEAILKMGKGHEQIFFKRSKSKG